ncbi:MAG: PAS domain S-box protein [Candidatus Omnitrophota bacterium]
MPTYIKLLTIAAGAICIVRIFYGLIQKKRDNKIRDGFEGRACEILENAPFGMYVVNDNGGIDYVNIAMAKMAGTIPEKFKSINALTLPTYVEIGLSKKIEEALAGNTFEMRSVRYRSFPGNKKTIRNFSGMPFKDGEDKKALVFVEDITAHVFTEEALVEEKNMAQAYFDLAEMIVVILDVKGRIAHINRMGMEMLGSGKGELVGKSWFDLFDPAKTKKDISSMFEDLVSGITDKIEYFETPVLTSKGGEARIIAWHYVTLKDSEGNVVNVLGSGEDVTDRKDVEEKIRRLANFTSENPQPSLRIAEDGVLLYSNAASLPILADWGVKVGDSVPAQWRSLVEDVLNSGLRENVEVRCKGQVYAFAVVPIKEAVYVNLYGRDITEEKKAIEKLKAAYTQLKETQSNLIQAEKMHVVGTLASGIAHEVKNPLAVIAQGIEFFSRNIKTKDKNLHDVLKYMDEAVKGADNIIKGLLDFSSVSKLDMQPEDLNAVLDQSLMLVKHQSDKYDVKIVKDFGVLSKIKMDRNKINQVFVNLFLNALYAMPKGGELSIKTYTKKSIRRGFGLKQESKDVLEIEEEITIAEIEDSGTGIPAKDLGRIFDPFFSTRRAKGGTGLGLSIVKNIIDMHNGKIEIVNRATGGAKVTVTLRT